MNYVLNVLTRQVGRKQEFARLRVVRKLRQIEFVREGPAADASVEHVIVFNPIFGRFQVRQAPFFVDEVEFQIRVQGQAADSVDATALNVDFAIKRLTRCVDV